MASIPGSVPPASLLSRKLREGLHTCPGATGGLGWELILACVCVPKNPSSTPPSGRGGFSWLPFPAWECRCSSFLSVAVLAHPLGTNLISSGTKGRPGTTQLIEVGGGQIWTCHQSLAVGQGDSRAGCSEGVTQVLTLVTFSPRKDYRQGNGNGASC